MENTKRAGGCGGFVSCRVSGCVYHSAGDRCRAEHISVENDAAKTKAQTYCSTFSPGE